MKVTFSIWERSQLESLVDNIQFAGGIQIGKIDMALGLKNKLNYSGKRKDDLDLDTQITLDSNEIIFLKEKAFSTKGWAVNERVKQLKDRLEEYSNSVEEEAA